MRETARKQTDEFSDGVKFSSSEQMIQTKVTPLQPIQRNIDSCLRLMLPPEEYQSQSNFKTHLQPSCDNLQPIIKVFFYSWTICFFLNWGLRVQMA